MKILLVNPPNTVLNGRPCVPYNILTIGSYLDNLGYEIKLIDMLIGGHDDLYKNFNKKSEISYPDRFWKKSIINLNKFGILLKNYCPDLVGISINFTETYYHSRYIIKKCKEILPDIPIIIGGIHANFNIKEILNENEVDIIVKNDGRKPLEEILMFLKKNELKSENLKKISNIAFKNNYKIIETEFKKSYLLNYYPNNYNLLKLQNYKDATILFSLFCPYKCPFCCAGNYCNPNYKPSIKDVMDELEFLIQKNISIMFGDNTFTLNKRVINQFFKKIKERKLHFKWKATTRVDQINRELLSKMKNVGCKGLLFGIETLHNDLLKRINKQTNYEQIKKAIKITKEADIDVISSFILGLPYQTSKHLIDQLKKMEQLGLLNKNLTMGWLVPFKGTDFYNNQTKYQLKILTNNYFFYSFRFPIVKTPHLSFSEMIKTFNFISIQIAEKIDPKIMNLFKDQSVLNYFLSQLLKWINWWKKKGWELPDPDQAYLKILKREIDRNNL